MALSESIKHTCEKALEEGMQMYKSTQRIPTVRLRGVKMKKGKMVSVFT